MFCTAFWVVFYIWSTLCACKTLMFAKWGHFVKVFRPLPVWLQKKIVIANVRILNKNIEISKQLWCLHVLIPRYIYTFPLGYSVSRPHYLQMCQKSQQWFIILPPLFSLLNMSNILNHYNFLFTYSISKKKIVGSARNLVSS